MKYYIIYKILCEHNKKNIYFKDFKDISSNRK